jgi:hypothetical protein
MPNNNTRLLVYLDACVFIDLIQTPPHLEPAKTIVSIIADAEQGKCDLITSTVTIAEAWCGNAEIERKEPSAEVERLVSRLWNPAASPHSAG